MKGEPPKGAATSLEALDKDQRRIILEATLDKVQKVMDRTKKLFEVARDKAHQRSILELSSA